MHLARSSSKLCIGPAGNKHQLKLQLSCISRAISYYLVMSQSPSGKHAGTASASKTDEDKSRPMHHKIVTNLQIQRAESTGSAYDGDISSPGSSPTESRGR